MPGTTRDLVTEVVDLDGLRVTLVDTAGLRDTARPRRGRGVARSRQSAARRRSRAGRVARPLDEPTCSQRQLIYKGLIVANKSDLPAGLGRRRCGRRVGDDRRGARDDCGAAIVEALDVDLLRDRPAITNVRHIALVERAHGALAARAGGRARTGGSLSEEFVLADLQEARAALEEITGRRRRTMCWRTSSRGSASGNETWNASRDERSRSRLRDGDDERSFDVIVIGAGHAGCEAAYAAARLGAHVGLCTLSTDTVAHMPCNPAVGGTAKGHLVREIDALGGLMGRAIDATGIQFKLLNRSRGPAVWSPRAQADKKVYGQWVKAALDAEPNIEWLIGRAGRILVEHGRIVGLAMEDGDVLRVQRAGRHDRHVSERPDSHRPRAASGRARRRAAVAAISRESLKSFGFEWGRLKTGTPPRLDRASIDFDRQVADGPVHAGARRRRRRCRSRF